MNTIERTTPALIAALVLLGACAADPDGSPPIATRDEALLAEAAYPDESAAVLGAWTDVLDMSVRSACAPATLTVEVMPLADLQTACGMPFTEFPGCYLAETHNLNLNATSDDPRGVTHELVHVIATCALGERFGSHENALLWGAGGVEDVARDRL